MFLVLSHRGDATAHLVGGILGERHGANSVRTIDAEDLASDVGWSHRLVGRKMDSSLRLCDGAVIHVADIDVVFNRLRFVSIPKFESSPDRDYAVAEMHALILSWLSSLECPVINRASVRGLAGADRGVAEWLLLAARAGLRSRRFRFTTDSRRFLKRGFEASVPARGARLSQPSEFEPVPISILGRAPAQFLEPVSSEYRRVLLVGDQVYGFHPQHLDQSLIKLARSAGCDLLEVVFSVSAQEESDGEGWTFCGASQFPDAIDVVEARAIAALLESKAMLTQGAFA